MYEVEGTEFQLTEELGQSPAFLPVPGSRLDSPFRVLFPRGHSALHAHPSQHGSLSFPVPLSLPSPGTLPTSQNTPDAQAKAWLRECANKKHFTRNE